MRKLINDTGSFVDEVMEGIFAANADRVRPATTDNRTLMRVDAPAEGRVSIITGGGSGHLPFFLGYVGKGLCSGVAIGNVFSSPSTAQIHAVSRATHGGAGVLYLYGNYGGDVYNFDLAADLCRAEGIDVRTVLGADDIVSAPENLRHTRRGVAGLVLVFKAAGAAADRGLSLDEVARVAQKAGDNTRTMGVGLAPTILPTAAKPTFELADGEMEIGVGIHGERGIHRGPLETADQVVDRFLAELERELDLTEGARVAVLVNGLGATPLEELYVMYRRLSTLLAERGVEIAYRLVGEYVTSLEMAGASVSIMTLDDELEGLLADPAESPFFLSAPSTLEPTPAADLIDVDAPVVSARRTGRSSVLRRTLLEVLPSMRSHAEELRRLDAVVGDGDLGITVSDGSDAVVTALTALPEDADTSSVLRETARVFAAANPSTFAALVGGGIHAAADRADGTDDVTRETVADLVAAAAARIQERGGAQRGDKTLVDVLLPLAEHLRATPDADAASAAEVARHAAAEVAELQSRRGRAAWQGDRTIGQDDPGSIAVTRFVEELARVQG